MTAPRGLVWLASYPKSGNTWFRILLANLDSGGHEPVDINRLGELGGDIASSRAWFESATMLESGLLSHDDIDSLRPGVYERAASELAGQRWVKVHDAYVLNANGEPTLGRGVARAAIYLVRDPRDVAVSLAHHDTATIDAAISLMNDPEGAAASGRGGRADQLRQRLLGWSGHAASWLDQSDTPVHLVRYEDLHANPVIAFGEALRFAGRAASAEEIARAVRHADFAELQRQEREKGFAERGLRATPFFREGRAGGWRDVLSDAQVGRLEAAHAPMMRRLGYRLETTPAARAAR